MRYVDEINKLDVCDQMKTQTTETDLRKIRKSDLPMTSKGIELVIKNFPIK